MYKVGICGHFGGDHIFVDGQTVKTKILKEELEGTIGKKQVMYVDTFNWRKKPLKLLLQCILLLKRCDNIIILPAHNGVKVFVPIFSMLNKLMRKRIHYFVVGGWLPSLISLNRWLLKFLKLFDNIFVETAFIKNSLNENGLNNIQVMPNFKNLEILDEERLQKHFSTPYKLCIFSRVMEEKGIEDAIEVVTNINSSRNGVVYELDIFGPIESEYEDKFNQLMKKSPEYISYKGVVDFNRSVEVLKNYFLLLFPTRFKTEGLPGTIIDAYAAGVPVVASKWNSAEEFVIEGKTGYIFEFKDITSFRSILEKIIDKPGMIEGMKNECLKKAEDYTPESIITRLLSEYIH
ncbi:glycosyltransferase family 4 protein [Neobacillus sp. SAB-20_R2A]|uniref:glycosyltransferase family 4 protein n=1 Tax=Neobacillus sp. SAB-20_R2A TaxID=3120519 RepID=UPI003C6E7AB4